MAMDGRMLQLWFCGSLLIGGTIGCHKQQTLSNGITLPKPGHSFEQKTPSLFSRPSSTPTPSQSATPSLSPTSTAKGEPVASTKLGGKVEINPKTLVAFADLRAEVAFSENTPAADREKQIDSARMAYQSALQKEPKNSGAMIGLARLYTRIGDLNRADESYRQFLTLNPKDHAAMHEAAMAHARAKDFTGAANWCQLALKVDPENRGYRKTFGFCLTHAGRWDDGFAVLCEVMPEAEARFTMARAFMTLNKPEMGQQQLALAIKADPAFGPARELLAEMQPATAAPRTVDMPSEVQPVQYQQPVTP